MIITFHGITVDDKDVAAYLEFLELRADDADIAKINTAWDKKISTATIEYSAYNFNETDDEDKIKKLIQFEKNFKHHQVRFHMFVAINNLKPPSNVIEECFEEEKSNLYKTIFALNNGNSTSKIDSSKLENGEYTEYLQQLFIALQQANNSNTENSFYKEQVEQISIDFTTQIEKHAQDKQENSLAVKGLVGAIIGAILGFIIGTVAGAAIGGALGGVVTPAALVLAIAGALAGGIKTATTGAVAGALVGANIGAISAIGLFNDRKNINNSIFESNPVAEEIKNLVGVPDTKN